MHSPAFPNGVDVVLRPNDHACTIYFGSDTGTGKLGQDFSKRDLGTFWLIGPHQLITGLLLAAIVVRNNTTIAAYERVHVKTSRAQPDGEVLSKLAASARGDNDSPSRLCKTVQGVH